ncbi:TonB-dependent receptor [Acinetobacter puyangensis]|nr:TonB-dependent receptor [Acinetobacter puyangensis]
MATESTVNTTEQPFQLGIIHIQAEQDKPDQIASIVTNEQLHQFNFSNVGDGLNLLSGVSLSNNARNEKMVYVRGFDARQVPVFIDGIPVYVPYDGYIDFNRFTIGDVSAIQVAKGFSSVSYGANTLGGAINLVSRKPSRPLEGQIDIGIADAGERQGALYIGSLNEYWYAQATASYLERDGFKLSSDFVPTTTEDGGLRNNSYSKDTKLALKFGLTPNQTDEYSLSYIKQDGEKGNPPTTGNRSIRYWQWPYWDKESVYFISNSTITEHETLKLRAYHDRYDNELNSFTDGQYNVLKTSGQGSVSTGRSIYHDRVNGASLTLESNRLPNHSISLVTHYKTDEHQELDATGEANTRFKDQQWSFAVEDNIDLGKDLLLSLGFARHSLEPDTVFSVGNPYSLPKSQHAKDAQIGLFYDGIANTQLYVTIARKSRLPTLKDRYSQRLGTYIENPDLAAEKAINYEMGYQTKFNEQLSLNTAIFLSDIKNKIQSVAYVQGDLSQMQNVGQVQMYGTEIEFNYQPWHWLSYGGNYTYLKLTDQHDANKITDIPQHKLINYLLIKPTETLDIQTFLERNSRRWVSNDLQLNGYQIVNMQIAYQPKLKSQFGQWRFTTGVNNLTDKNYALADGFPSAGRMWFSKATLTF